MTIKPLALVLFFVLVSGCDSATTICRACGDAGSTSDGATSDGSAAVDLGAPDGGDLPDSGTLDSSTPPPDSGVDSGPLSSACAIADGAWALDYISPDPACPAIAETRYCGGGSIDALLAAVAPCLGVAAPAAPTSCQGHSTGVCPSTTGSPTNAATDLVLMPITSTNVHGTLTARPGGHSCSYTIYATSVGGTCA